LSFMATSNVVLIAPTAFVVFAVVALLWVFAVKKLSYRVNEGLERKAREVAHVENGSTASASPA